MFHHSSKRKTFWACSYYLLLSAIKNNVPSLPRNSYTPAYRIKQRKQVTSASLPWICCTSPPGLFTSIHCTHLPACQHNHVPTFHCCHCKRILDPDLTVWLLQVTSAVAFEPYKYVLRRNRLLNVGKGNNDSLAGSWTLPGVCADYRWLRKGVVPPTFPIAPKAAETTAGQMMPFYRKCSLGVVFLNSMNNSWTTSLCSSFGTLKSGSLCSSVVLA